MKILALQELPQGQQPGTVFDIEDDAAAVLITVGAARAVTDDEIPVAEPTRRTYRRRDMQATQA